MGMQGRTPGSMSGIQYGQQVRCSCYGDFGLFSFVWMADTESRVANGQYSQYTLPFKSLGTIRLHLFD